MTDDREDGGPTPEDPDGVDPATAFSSLGHAVRVDVLRELNDHCRESDDETIGFADLRRRVGLSDSGQFRYHLNELRDHFVERVDDGYRLTQAGGRVVGAILAGTHGAASPRGPVVLDDCPLCGTDAAARYEDGRCVVRCEDDHTLFTWTVPPNAASDRSLEDLVAFAELLAIQSIKQAQAGVCSACYDPVEPAVDPDREMPLFRSRCDTCGTRIVGPVGFCLLAAPDVRAACRDGERSLEDRHVWQLPFVVDPATVQAVCENPTRVAVTIPLPDGDLRVTLDGRGTVVGLDGPE